MPGSGNFESRSLHTIVIITTTSEAESDGRTLPLPASRLPLFTRVPSSLHIVFRPHFLACSKQTVCSDVYT